MPGCLSLFRTEVFRRHCYDLAFRYYFEDFEWCYRVWQSAEGEFYRNIRALGFHYHQWKIPSRSLPLRERRRQQMRYAEMLALLYKRHGLVNPDIFSFLPELKRQGDPYPVPRALRLFELINTHGSEWVLEEWNNGALTNLLDENGPATMRTGRNEVTTLRAELRRLSSLYEESQRAMDESQRAMKDILNSKSFKITSLYARLRRRK